MAYINPQVQIDQQQNERNDRNMAAIGSGFTNFANAFEENRRRAVDQARADKALKLQQEEGDRNKTLFDAKKRELDYQENQRNMDPLKRDDFIKESAIEAMKQKAKSNPTSDLALYEKKQQIKNKYKDTQNDEGVAKAAQTKIIQNNVGLANVKSAMDSALTILQDKNVPEDQKIKTGQSLYKLLNSAEGADAVGAEEAKRIGSYLEYHIGNFTQPGAFVGRDLNGFTNQIKNYSTLLGDRVKRNEQTAEGLKQGKKISETIQSQPVRPKTVIQNGHTYTLNEQTGEYE